MKQPVVIEPGASGSAQQKINALQSENAELKRKIEEHNARCDRIATSQNDRINCICNSSYKKCTDCPKDWRIDL
jgi:hypothetical protein